LIHAVKKYIHSRYPAYLAHNDFLIVCIGYENDFDQPTTIHKVFLESTQVETLDFRPSLCDLQRNMEVAEKLCSNLRIGQYFSHFDIYQLRFVPNDILQVSYPNDYTASPISNGQ
jgi:hypothetical protein